MAWTQWVAAAASLLAGALFWRVAATVSARRMDGGAGRAGRAFGLWWGAIALNVWANAGLVLAGIAGSVWVASLARAAGLVLAGLAMAGLVTYLVFVYTGKDRGAIIGGSYFALVVASLLLFFQARPHVLQVNDWSVEVGAAGEGFQAFNIILTAGFLLPPVVAGLSLLRLAPRSVDEDQKARIVAVGLGVPLWSLMHLSARLAQADLWQFTTRVLVGVAVASWIAAAYRHPPAMGAPGQGLSARLQELV